MPGERDEDGRSDKRHPGRSRTLTDWVTSARSRAPNRPLRVAGVTDVFRRCCQNCCQTSERRKWQIPGVSGDSSNGTRSMNSATPRGLSDC